jgi:hypothetical protein
VARAEVQRKEFVKFGRPKFELFECQPGLFGRNYIFIFLTQSACLFERAERLGACLKKTKGREAFLKVKDQCS